MKEIERGRNKYYGLTCSVGGYSPKLDTHWVASSFIMIQTMTVASYTPILLPPTPQASTCKAKPEVFFQIALIAMRQTYTRTLQP